MLGVLEWLTACLFQSLSFAKLFTSLIPRMRTFSRYFVLVFFGEALSSVASALNYNSTSSHSRTDNKYSGLGVIYRSSLGYLYHSTVVLPAKTSYCNKDIGIFTKSLSFFN